MTACGSRDSTSTATVQADVGDGQDAGSESPGAGEPGRSPALEQENRQRDQSPSESESASADQSEPAINSVQVASSRSSGSPSASADSVPGPSEAGQTAVTSSGSAPASAATSTSAGAWQAVWSAPHNAYYFWNAQTNATTWTNPLAPADDSHRHDSALQSSSGLMGTHAGAGSPGGASEAGPASTDLDPDLAFLDPTLYAAASGSSGSGNSGGQYTAQGTFDRRTGRFVPSDPSAGDLHDPSRHSQSARAQRQMNAYFDVDEWQRSRETDAARQSASEDKRQRHSKHPTRKELEMYKERRKEKRNAKYGWLKS
ncbi:unnamed protein product [Parajaminaea phylloscopi]